MNKPTVVRETFADELRGFALLGIVLVNAPFLGISGQGFTSASLTTPVDQIAAFFTVAFAQAKFYLLFSFLFGYSLSFIIKANNPLSTTQFKRRLTGLALLGALHAVFFFVGDILLMYGLLGFVLLWLNTKSNRVVVRTIYATSTLWILVFSLLFIATWIEPVDKSFATAVATLDAALKSGSFVSATNARLNIWPMIFFALCVLNGLGVLTMFCIGLIAGRHQLLANPGAHTALWQRGSWCGLLIGLPAALISAYLAVGQRAVVDTPGLRETGGILLGFVTAPFLTWGYVSWLALLRQRFPNALQWCRNAGRMSLTGYIGESILLSLIFCSYGLGLFGQLSAAMVMLIALLVWLLLDVFTHVWQRHFQYGPFEQFLRTWVGKGKARGPIQQK